MVGGGGGLLQAPQCQGAPGWAAMPGARPVGSYLHVSWGGGRVGSLQATLPAAGGGREVRGRGMGPGCARESVVCGVWGCEGGE